MVASPRRIRSLTSALVAVRRLNSTSGCSAAKRFKIADSRPPASVPTTASATGPEFGRASARTAFSASWAAATARSAYGTITRPASLSIVRPAIRSNSGTPSSCSSSAMRREIAGCERCSAFAALEMPPRR